MKHRKYLIVVVMILLIASAADARMVRRAGRSLVELAPKATIYIGDDTDFGIGLEGIFNTSSKFGVRLDLAEIRFDNTTFYLNFWQSLDGLFYYPIGAMDSYFHAGFGLISIDTGAGSSTYYTFRGGMGFNFPVGRAYDLYFEPGLIITGNGDSDVILRLAGGMKFGVVR